MQIRKEALALSAVHVLALILVAVAQVHAGQVRLAWDDPKNNPAAVGGYNLYYWQIEWTAPARVDVGKTTTYTLSDLEDGKTYHLAVTAYDLSGETESAFSNELVITMPPSSEIITVEAESMTLIRYRRQSSADASGGRLISRYRARGAPPGLARLGFPGPAGTYDVIVAYFDENDGQSTLEFVVNGVVVDTWVAADDLPANSPRAVTLAHRVVAQKFPLAPGDVIQLKGSEQSSEYAGIDKIDFVPVSR
jgi:hypothetical protein